MFDVQTYTPIQGARWMAKQGVPITPLNGKIPFGNGWQDAATNDVAELNILAQTHKGNFGCVAKKGEGGFWMVDEDVVGFFERFTQETGIVLDTLFVNSSAGRRHGYFKATAESDELFGKNIPERLLGGAASVRTINNASAHSVCTQPTRLLIFRRTSRRRSSLRRLNSFSGSWPRSKQNRKQQPQLANLVRRLNKVVAITTSSHAHLP